MDGDKLMENPYLKRMTWGKTPLISETSDMLILRWGYENLKSFSIALP